MTNSADPDQLASSKPTGLDLHCLQRQGISSFSRTRVNAYMNSKSSDLPTNWYKSRPWWLNWMRRLTGDQEVAGSTPAEVGNILS